MRGRGRWVVMAAVLAPACADAPARGEIVVRAAPGARVDVMAAGSPEVSASVVADPEGRARVTIGDDDQVVVIPREPTDVVVIAGLRPGREYVAEVRQPVSRTIAVTWDQVPEAFEYAVSTRCGGSSLTGGLVLEMGACPDGDHLILQAFGASGALLGAVTRAIPPFEDGALVQVLGPLTPPRAVEVRVRPPVGGAVEAISVDVTLIATSGVSVPARTPQGGVATLPDVPGVVRLQAALPAPDGSAWRLEQRGALADVVDLDLTALPLPALASDGAIDPRTGQVVWTMTGTDRGTPDTTRLRLVGADGRAYTLIAPYAGPQAALPALPPDLPALAPAGRIGVALAATPQGYNVTVNTLARRFDPSYGPYTLALSTYLD